MIEEKKEEHVDGGPSDLAKLKTQATVIGRQPQAAVAVEEAKVEDSFDNYKLLRRLAKSGCGSVYLVKHKVTGEYFAMKSIRKDFIIKNELLDCLINEKTIMQDSDHPFILKLISCFKLPLRIYFLMPFLPGGDLRSQQRRYQRFNETQVKFFAAQIASSLVSLHKQGIVYRDLKPENILVQRDGYLMLADFGIAARLGEGELSQSFCGTYDYMGKLKIFEPLL